MQSLRYMGSRVMPLATKGKYQVEEEGGDKVLSEHNRSLVDYAYNFGKTKSALHGKGEACWFRVVNWYYTLLDTSWFHLGVFIFLCYVLVCTIMSIITFFFAANLAHPIADSSMSSYSNFIIAAFFSISNVVTMSHGFITPASSDTFALATLQQMLGVILNVLVFSVFVAKFQHPIPQLIFSTKAIITKRDGVPHLLFRLGNLRCNMIYFPDIRVSILVRNRTVEREVYMKYTPLEIVLPNMVTACTTVSHKIDESSPLFSFDFEQDLHLLTISVMFSGQDAVYNDTLHCVTTYSGPSLLLGGYIFEDMMETDPTTRQLSINFKKFDRLKAIQADQSTSPAAVLEDEAAQEELSLDSLEPDVIYLCCPTRPGAANSKQYNLCIYTKMLEVLLIESKVAYQKLPLPTDKPRPAWLEDAFRRRYPATSLKLVDHNPNFTRRHPMFPALVHNGQITFDYRDIAKQLLQLHSAKLRTAFPSIEPSAEADALLTELPEVFFEYYTSPLHPTYDAIAPHSDGREPALCPGFVYLAVGCTNRNLDRSLPINPQFLVKTCNYSRVIEILLIEAAIPYKPVLIDLADKPQWFKDNTSGSTPNLFIDEEWLSGTANIIGRLRERFGDHLRDLDLESPLPFKGMELYERFKSVMTPYLMTDPRHETSLNKKLRLKNFLEEIELVLSERKYLCSNERIGIDDILISSPVWYYCSILLSRFLDFDIRREGFVNLAKYLDELCARSSFVDSITPYPAELVVYFISKNYGNEQGGMAHCPFTKHIEDAELSIQKQHFNNVLFPASSFEDKPAERKRYTVLLEKMEALVQKSKFMGGDVISVDDIYLCNVVLPQVSVLKVFKGFMLSDYNLHELDRYLSTMKKRYSFTSVNQSVDITPLMCYDSELLVGKKLKHLRCHKLIKDKVRRLLRSEGNLQPLDEEETVETPTPKPRRRTKLKQTVRLKPQNNTLGEDLKRINSTHHAGADFCV